MVYRGQKYRRTDRSSVFQEQEFHLKISSKVQAALDRVGVPRRRPFKPDPFQLEAVEQVSASDVLVTAPTGSGKTWIAVQAMQQVFERGCRTWYASPLKALSNAKYKEFQEHFGPMNVGILTGDRKENASAPIVVGTTEIFRNHLYDAMHTGENLALDLMVLDEAHFLGDPDRGMVWEEILIYLPPRIRLLLLSATISNAQEIADWLYSVRGNQPVLVRAEERPVPLYSLFLFPDGEVVPLLDKGHLNGKVRKFEDSRREKRFRLPSLPISWGAVLKGLRSMNLLPALLFLKSRSDCSTAASLCPPAPEWDPEKERRFRERLDELLEEMPFLKGHPHLLNLRRAKAAAHHGGQLPHWKLLVESLMKEGLLEAIFATSTVAAGVNFPARTVAFMNSDRFNGRTFENLTSTELHQMLGRAGRRGMDRIGFALVLPGPFQRPALVAELLKSEPEPIMSQMRVSFSMVLNLLLSHAPEEIRELLKRSLFLFQGSSHLLEREQELGILIRELEPGVTNPRCGTARDMLVYMERQQEAVHRQRFLRRRLKGDRLTWFRRSHLVRGRLFLSRKRKRFCVVEAPDLRSGDVFRAVPVSSDLKLRKGRMRTREFHIRRIGPLLDYRVDLPEQLEMQEAADRIRDAAAGEYDPLSTNAPLDPYYADQAFHMEEELKQVREELKQLPCRDCAHWTLCHGREDPEWKMRAEQAAELMKQVEAEKERVWADFKRHLGFLQNTGFVDLQGRLTEDGAWSARLRLDQPLLIAEAIRRGVLTAHSPAILAGLVAVFVWERSLDSDLPEGWIENDEELHQVFQRLMTETMELKKSMERNGFSTPPFQYRPAATLFSWASGATWDETRYVSDLDEGDLAMLIYRTADNLRQLVDLRASHPALADTAARAVDIILREPVLPY